MFRIRLGTRVYNVLCGREANKWTTRNERDFLTAEGAWDGASKRMGGLLDANLANIDGKKHVKMRGLFRRTMGRVHAEARLDDAIGIFHEELAALSHDTPIDILPVLQRTVYRQLGTNTTGQAPPQLFDDYLLLIDEIIRVTRAPFLTRLPIPRKVKRANQRIGAFTRELTNRAQAVAVDDADATCAPRGRQAAHPTRVARRVR